MRFGLVACAVLACLVGAGAAARAGTLTQTVVITQVANLTSPADGSATIIPASAFDASFAPFIGTGLTSATFSFSVAVSANYAINPGNNGGDVSLAAELNYIDAAGGTGGGVATGTGGAPGASGSLAPAPGGGTDSLAVPPLTAGDGLVGSAPVVFTNTNGVTLNVTNIASFDLTDTTTVTLTYTYTGDGALNYAVLPEPASLAVMGMGLSALSLIRRRRGATARL